MHRTTRPALGARSVLFLTLALALTPGCELATHFGDYSSGGGSDMGGVDGGDSDGGDGGARDAGDAGDARIDVGPLPDGGDAGGTTHTVSVTVDGTGMGTVTAMGGSLTCTTGTCDWTVADGTVLAIHGAPDTLSTLAWSGACASTAAGSDCMLTVTSNQMLGATFDLRRVTLTVQVVSPPGRVTSTAPSTLGIDCDGAAGSSCTASVDAGTSITLSAAPMLPNTDAAWAGATCTGTSCMFTINDDTTISVTFTDGRPVVSVNVTGNGTVDSNDMRISCVSGAGACSQTYDPGGSVTLTAVADPGWTFASWSGCDSTMGTTCTISTLATHMNRTITATFTQNHYTVTVNVGGTALGTVSNATVTCTNATSPCTIPNVTYGTMITLNAAPNAGARLSGWTGATCVGSSCSFTVNSDMTVGATFVPDQRTIAIAIPAGIGEVFADTVPLDCFGNAGATSGVCMGTYDVGTTFMLTALPGTGYRFSSWSSSDAVIGCSGSGTSCTVTIAAGIPAMGGTVTANLAVQRYDLTVTAVADTGAGNVTITPGTTSSCSATPSPGHVCTNNYTYNTMVTLHGAPAGGSVFLGWSGGSCTGTADCVVTIDAARAVTGTFAVMTNLLQVNTSGTMTGTVTSTSPAGAINCGSTCSAMLASGTMVTLHATPAANYVFSGWSGGGCSGTADCTVTVSGATIVTATFVPVQYPLNVATSGTSGSVVDSLARINCPGTCSANYDHGTMVTLTANAGSGSIFMGWGGACSGASSTCLVNMNMARNVTATFVAASATVTVSPSGGGTGLVTLPSGGQCHLPSGGASDTCSGSFSVGSSVLLTATPGAHSHVTAWSGCTPSPDLSSCTLTVSGNTTVTVQFALDTFLVNVHPSPMALGTIASSDSMINCGAACGALYPWGTSIVLNGTPSGTAQFGTWSGSVTGFPCQGSTSSSCAFTVTQAIDVTATFVPQRTLTLNMRSSTSAAGSRVFFGTNTCTTSATAMTTCTYTVPDGTQVTLRSDSQPDYLGPSYSGVASCGSGPDCRFTISADTSITVAFAPLGNLMWLSGMMHNGMFGSTASVAQGNADALCQAEATAAGFPMGTYIAWLSTTASPMSARVPMTDNVFVRPDGRPVATTRSQLFNGALTFPVAIRSNGTSGTNSTVWTGTQLPGGGPGGTNCTDFTSAGGPGRVGNSGQTGTSWSDTGTASGCVSTNYYYCMQTGASGLAPIGPPITDDAVYIFTSSVGRDGSYGLVNMDRVCADEASTWGLAGHYVALTGTMSGGTAFSRARFYGTLTRADGWPLGPHSSTTSVLLNNTPYTGNWAVTAFGSTFTSLDAWTGMTGGTANMLGSSCTDWSSASSVASGSNGNGTSINAPFWGGSTTALCNTVHNWYCIRDGM